MTGSRDPAEVSSSEVSSSIVQMCDDCQAKQATLSRDMRRAGQLSKRTLYLEYNVPVMSLSVAQVLRKMSDRQFKEEQVVQLQN